MFTVTRRRARGFTLVELIVVILILGILAAIGVVGYTNITDRAQQTAALANLRQVATATVAQHTADQAPQLTRAGMLDALEEASVEVVDGLSGASTWTLYGTDTAPEADGDFAVGFDTGQGTGANDVGGTRAVVITTGGAQLFARVIIYGGPGGDLVDGDAGAVPGGTTPTDILGDPTLITDPAGPGDPGDGGNPTDPGNGGGNPGGGSGGSGPVALADTNLPVCVDAYTSVDRIGMITRTGTEATGYAWNIAPSDLTFMDSVNGSWYAVEFELPGAPASTEIYVETYWNSYRYRDEGVRDPDTGLWRANAGPAVQFAELNGYAFTFFSPAAGTPQPQNVRLLGMYTLENPEYQWPCGEAEGMRGADGAPAASGVHWDSLDNGVQYTLRSSLVPAGTQTVDLTCTVTQAPDGGWPQVGDQWAQSMYLLDSSYGRYVTRWQLADFAGPVWHLQGNTGWGPVERTCQATARDDDGNALRTFATAGGAFIPLENGGGAAS